jgi:hypothetical protein
MSRKDYRAIASALKAFKEGQEAGFNPSLADIASALASVLAQDNSRFDRSKFLEACGV